MHTRKKLQTGVALIEAMVAILVFAVGVLALIGMQSLAVKTSTDAKFRSDAAYLANQLIGQMWTADRSTLTTFRHNCSNAAGCAPTCTPTSSASSNTVVQAWLNQIAPGGGTASLLPGTSSSMITISVVPVAPVAGVSLQTGNTYQVAVSICWQLPEDKAATPAKYRQYVTAAQIS